MPGSSHARALKNNERPIQKWLTRRLEAPDRNGRARLGVHVFVVVTVLAIHSALLAWSGYIHSPTWDEVGHFAAGISHWHFGSFDLYNVNPPLVRLVAAGPVMLAGITPDWNVFFGDPDGRAEFDIGRYLFDLYGPRAFYLLTIARWTCIPFSVLGGIVCLLWSTRLFGRAAGLLSLTLWCFGPNILGHASLITPDVPAAALGVLAWFVFSSWLAGPDWRKAVAAGLCLGCAELAKTTWVANFALWPITWMAIRQWGGAASRSIFIEAPQMGTIMILAIYVINLGYGFESTGRPLGEFEFRSQLFRGPTDSGNAASPANVAKTGNRFHGGYLSLLPVPLPANYVLGIDLQKRDFERGLPSYLHGRWENHGWWYYYIYAMAIKVPLGAWGLGALALAAYWREGVGTVSLKSVAIPLIAGITMFTFVSLQTGFSHHLRYVFPSFPFFIILISRVAAFIIGSNKVFRVLYILFITWFLGASLAVYPHSLAYFNEIVGGPKRGHYYLGNSNADWGQDLFFLAKWCDEHPEARPLHLAYEMPFVEPRLAGIHYEPILFGQDSPITENSVEIKEGVPFPRWFAISVNHLHARHGRFRHFLPLRPEARIGYTINIYRISLADANRMRSTIGLARISQDGHITGSVSN